MFLRKRTRARLGLTIAATVTAVAVSSVPMPVADAHTRINCSAVKNRQLRVKDSTQWSDALVWAIAQWQAVGPVNVVADQTNPTLTVADYRSTTDGWNGYFNNTSGCNKVMLNNHGLEQHGKPGGPRNTVTHELGHALKLGHNYGGQVMEASANSIKSPQGHDKDDYYAIWGKGDGSCSTARTTSEEDPLCVANTPAVYPQNTIPGVNDSNLPTGPSIDFILNWPVVCPTPQGPRLCPVPQEVNDLIGQGEIQP